MNDGRGKLAVPKSLGVYRSTVVHGLLIGFYWPAKAFKMSTIEYYKFFK